MNQNNYLCESGLGLMILTTGRLDGPVEDSRCGRNKAQDLACLIKEAEGLERCSLGQMESRREKKGSHKLL